MERHGRPRGTQPELSVGVETLENVQLRELRKIFGYWLVEFHFSLLDELQSRYRGDRLGHGRDGEDRIDGE